MLQEGIVPGAAAAFAGDAVLAGMLFEEGEQEAVQPGEFLAEVAIADVGFVFAKRLIQTPVTSFFEAQVSANRSCEAFNSDGQATEVLPSIDRLLAVDYATRERHALGQIEYAEQEDLFRFRPLRDRC